MNKKQKEEAKLLTPDGARANDCRYMRLAVCFSFLSFLIFSSFDQLEMMEVMLSSRTEPMISSASAL